MIGVNSQIATNGLSAGNVGIGFAVPSNTVRQVLPGLKRQDRQPRVARRQDRHPRRPSTPSGAEIGSVTTGGPADDAGLQAKDIVTEIDGQRIDDATDLSSYVNTKAPGDKIVMTVQRNGQTEKIDVLLADRPPKVP